MNTPIDVHAAFHAGLLTVHSGLRAWLQELLSLSDETLGTEVAGLTTRYAGALNGHHHMEDTFLFPAIRRDSRLKSSDIAFLEARGREHQAIHGTCDALLVAAGRVASMGSAEAREELRHMARELQALLAPHLEEEETGLVPHHLVRMISADALVRMHHEIEAARGS